MAIRDYIPFVNRKTSTIEKKEAPQVYVQNHSPYHSRNDNFKAYANEGYRQNAIVFRCVTKPIASRGGILSEFIFLSTVERKFICSKVYGWVITKRITLIAP